MSSAENPADEGSRGVTAKHFVQKSKWLKGPEFWRESEEKWSEQEIDESEIDAADHDPEVNGHVNTNVVTEKNDMLRILERFSSWKTIKTALTICLRYKKKLKDRIVAKKDKSTDRNLESESRERVSASSLITVKDLEEAEVEIIKLMQADAFATEMKSLN